MNKLRWKNGELSGQVNTTRHCETNGMCAAASGGVRRKEGRWCGHGQTGQVARHVLTRCVQHTREWRRAQQSNDDLCNAPRVASSASHDNCAETASRRTTQQARHNAVISASTSCTPASAYRASPLRPSPQATEQASNNTQPQALLPPLSLRAQLLFEVPPQSVLLLNTRLSSLTSHAAREVPSAQQDSTAPPLSLHHIGNVPPRAQLLPQHRQAAWLVRDLSHLRFLSPPSATQMNGERDSHGGAWSLGLRVISVRPC
ncbi:hypothetical protein TRVL_09029 [Trypanosoma vivax]|nr:hypothetical protein TRVL_09029 [Trypanosoma vivax]